MNPPARLDSAVRHHTLYITLNRPEKHNCFGIPELDRMDELLKRSESDKDIRAVVFRGAGERSFSTGADLKQFTTLDKDGTTDWIRRGHDVFNRIADHPKPTVAVIQGYALGGGLELALACDIRIASFQATFGSPELQHGWLPGWGGIQRLHKLAGPARTKEILFLGEQISAEEAYRFGLINRLVEAEKLDKEAEKMLEKFVTLNPETVAMAKAALTSSGKLDSTSLSDIWFDILSTHFAKGSS